MVTFTPDTTNTLFRLAQQLVNQTGRSLFLTGKAGTGKTTFLKYIRENCPKQMAVVAPTGVAAINAGGVTIHSFLQLPFAPFLPESKGFSGNGETVNRHSLVSRLRFTNEKRKVLQQLELLVIDEISMVRCDVMDAIDTVLRHLRRRPLERFGGVQMLFIGDMFQLPPVIKEAEWKLLADHYQSPYFFDSHVIREEPPLYIEFDKIYRQSETKFIQVLNQVRNNELDAEGAAILESRYFPGFRHEKKDGYIILTTHNESARNINTAELNTLATGLYTYEAKIEGDFPENAYPAEQSLRLKTGAQVMFIKNDTADRGKRYFNGRIGTVKKLEEDKVIVQCEAADPENGELPGEIEVTREKWENIRYTVNKNSQTLEEDVLGSFSQFPLRLAWAITIHKSQGLTFDKAIIDAGEAFAPGQVYVALSRCTNLAGMVLRSRLRSKSLFTDPRIVAFAAKSAGSAQLQEELTRARRHYIEKIWKDAFDYSAIIGRARECMKYVKDNLEVFNAESIPWIENWLEKLNQLQETGLKFGQWLDERFGLPASSENTAAIGERTAKASAHFIKITEEIMGLLQKSPAVTDNNIQAKEFNEQIKEIFTGLAARKFMLPLLGPGFDAEQWHRRVKEFVLPPFSVNAYAGASPVKTESPHPALYLQLKKLRDSICARKDLPIYLVAGSQTLNEMTEYLPQDLAELRKISGFGEAKSDRYGQQFLDIILDYCRDKNLASRISEKSPKRERKTRTGPPKKKGDSHAASFRLYKEGMSIAAIAESRNLAVGTIETHLVKFVRSGEINIEDLVSPQKIALIRSALVDFTGGSITTVKEKLGADISFGEIRLVMAGMGMDQENSAE